MELFDFSKVFPFFVCKILILKDSNSQDITDKGVSGELWAPPVLRGRTARIELLCHSFAQKGVPNA
jgi:hypothetical protein